ncbi:AfsR/SARP family transcriptional regulator [Nonomuraea dietziae]|uniref:AfsR/SARP family transcriptional regulator n=1 Tax=Nonomuraea dietziae TaxID=65515 RepID=UPI0031D71846
MERVAPGRAPAFEFHVLGPLTVVKDGAELAMSANRELVILASLLLNANRVMSVERLVEAVWAGSAPRSAWRQVAICVSRLRRTLGAGLIETSSPGYLLRASPASIDWLRFRELVARSRGQGRRRRAGGRRPPAARRARALARPAVRGHPRAALRRGADGRVTA